MTTKSSAPLSPTAAVDRLEALYQSASAGLATALDAFLASRRPPTPAERAQFRYPLLRIRYAGDGTPPPATRRAYAKLQRPGRLRDHGDASARLPQLSARAARAARRRLRRHPRGRAQRSGDPLPLRARARRGAGPRRRHVRRARPPLPDSASVGRRRRDSGRRLRSGRGRAAPARTVRRRPRRLLASPSRPLHGQRLAPRSALDPADQLPPLRRSVRAQGQRRAATPRRDRPARPPRQCDHRARHLAGGGGAPCSLVGLAPLPDAGLPSHRARRRRRHADQHRRRPVERQEHHRPPRGDPPQLLADDRPLRWPARKPVDRRLRAGPRLPAPGPHPRRAGAARGTDPRSRRGAGRAAGGRGERHRPVGRRAQGAACAPARS